MAEPRRKGRLLLIAFLGGLLVVSLLGERLTLTSSSPLTGCIEGRGTGGGLGLARWARKLGYNVRGLDVPVWEAPGALSAPTGNCILTFGNGDWSPAHEGLTAERWQALRRWLGQGNTLIVVSSDPKRLPTPLVEDLFPSFAKKEDAVPKLGFSFGSSAVKSDPELTQVAALGYGNLSMTKNGPRWGVPADIASSRPGADARLEWAADESGSCFFRVEFGNGTLYLLLDDFAWTNAGLDRGENAQVLANILRSAAPAREIAVDEYRHGHGRAESFLTFLLGLPGAKPFLWMAAIWGALYFHGRNARFRPLLPHETKERRTSREFIDAVAQLHERARAAPLAVEAVARRFRHLLRDAGAPNTPAGELLQRAERHVAEEARPARPAQAMKLMNQLIQLRKKLYGSRTVS